MLGQVLAERLVHHCGVVKDLRHIRLEQDYIGATHVPRVVLAADTAAEIHLRDVIVSSLINCVVHRIDALLVVLHAP